MPISSCCIISLSVKLGREREIDMELQHFLHEHPLILREEDHKDDDTRFKCIGCEELIYGPFYSCDHDEFRLHKFCAELPREILEHPMHQQHPLTLKFSPYPGGSFICDVCQKSGSSTLTFHCYLCQFDMDIKCALRANRVEHQSHKHPLMLLERPTMVSCYACGKEHKGMSYVCTTCSFWVNYNCASLPTTIKRPDHEHSLTLAYSFPLESFKWSSYCCVCTKKLDPECWLYYCAECRYFAHVDCRTSVMDLSRDFNREIKLDDNDLMHNSVCLPVSPDESINLVTQFLKEMSHGENKRAKELNHFSHDHPLIFSNLKSNDESCSGSKFPPLNQQKNDAICEACVRPVTAPFYSCNQCNFFLHEWCAELPNELQHPLDEAHPFTLLNKAPQNLGIFTCLACRNICNGFTFNCAHCDNYLDVKCGSLPRTITHEAHDHLLILQPADYDPCDACDMPCSYSQYKCVTCNYRLHSICALLHRTFSHRYDTHPFILTYSPVENHPKEYYCELCEREINPQRWFYHCGKCDQSICTKCTSQIYDNCSNIKFGGTINLEGHPHHLTLVRCTNEYPKCNLCDWLIFSSDLVAFSCSQCIFKVHTECASSCSKPSC